MKKPIRGSAKESKSIQAKHKARSFFDYTEEEKRAIMLKAAEGANEMQRETIRMSTFIPRIIKTKTYRGIDIKDIQKFLSPADYSKFCNWFAGKTGGIHKGKYLVFDYDFKRFLDHVGISVGGWI